MDEKIELKLTKGNILRFLNACFILLFFMPTMLVSCSGETVKISASKITFGFEVLGQKIDGHIAEILRRCSITALDQNQNVRPVVRMLRAVTCSV